MENAVDYNAFKNELGERLRLTREFRGFTIQEVSKYLTKSAATITSWEQGRREPTASEAIQLSQLYSVPVTNLITGVSEKDIEERSDGYDSGVVPVEELPSFTQEELNLINSYRELRKDRKAILLSLIKNFQEFAEEERHG